MTKYRLRLGNGRVIGPFELGQLQELKAKGHISGKEEAQVFPAGNWAPVTTFEFYLVLGEKEQANVAKKEETFVIDLTKLRNNQKEKEVEAADISRHEPLEKLTTTLRMAPAQLNIEIQKKAGPEPVTSQEVIEEKPEPTETDAGNKTLINPVAQQELERMRRTRAAEEEKRKSEEEKQKQEEDQRIKEEEQRAVVVQPLDESTQMITLDVVKKELMVIAEEEEVKIVKEAKAIKKKKKLEESEDEKDDKEDEDTGAKKKKIIVVVAVLVVLFAVFFPEDNSNKPKQFVHLDPDIQFPVPFDKADSKKAEAEFNKGKELFDSGTYPDLVKAGPYFKRSYENNIENYQALNYMIRVYGEEIIHSKNMVEDTQTLFNIIQSKRPYLSVDPNGVIGMSLFYTAIGKHEASADVIMRFLKVYGNDETKRSPDLFATYTISLIKVGRIDQAKTFYTALVKNYEKLNLAKNQYVLKALIEYALLNQEAATALSYIETGIRNFPKQTYFLLKKADLLIKEKKVKEVEPLLESLSKLNHESNVSSYARYLEVKGLTTAFKGDVKKATELLKKSLAMEDSNDLRTKLADLESRGAEGGEADKLIAESKAIKYLLESQEFYNKRNYEFALTSAIKASDEFPGHIASKLFLAKVQLKLGLAEQALLNLADLQKQYPDNKDVNFALLDAYIETYKFFSASNQIATLSTTDFKMLPEFASYNAKLYIKKGDTLQAISWLKTSINANPLNDEDMFLLAELLIKRANYDAAKTYLNKCIELDPSNPNYRIAYAKTIYETQDDLAAIGYLLGLEKDFGENPKIISEIAIFYYRAGRVKDFQDYKAKIEKLPNKDKTLYEFLIRAALLDEKYDDIPKLVEQLLSIEPGEIESMMTAGRVLFENGKLPEAATWFKRVKNKLSTYPKVQYYIAKIKLLAGEIDDPKTDKGEPLKDEDGKVIHGAQNIILEDIKINGENDASLVLLADVYLKQEKLLEAENTLKKAQKLNPRSFEALMGLAELSTKRNNFDLALDLYKKAMNEKNDDPIIHKKIGDVYRLLGQGTLAMESYKVYLEMNPDASDKANIEAYINMMQ